MLKLAETVTVPETEAIDVNNADSNTTTIDYTAANGDGNEVQPIEVRKRLSGCGKMSNRLFHRYDDEILPLLNRALGSDAEWKYLTGVVVVDIKDNHLVYKQGDMVELAKVLECHRSTLDDYGGVARTWTREQFDELIRRRCQAKDKALSFSHLIELSALSDPLVRNSMLELVLEHAWSVRQLREQIQLELNGPQEPAAEASGPDDIDPEPIDVEVDVVTPITIQQSVIRMRGSLQLVPGMYQEWEARIFVPLAENPGFLGEDARTEIGRALADCDEMIRVAEQIKTHLRDTLRGAGDAKIEPGESYIDEGGKSNG